MTSFVVKKIVQEQTVGEKLQAARETLGLTLKQAANSLKIGTKYLQALENNAYNLIPGEVYAKNFIKVYSQFLQLEPKEFLSQYKSEQRIYDKTKKVKTGDFKTPVARVPKFYLLVTPKILRGLITLILAMAVLGYLGVKIYAIVTPPDLLIESPLDSLEIKTSFIEVTGRTEPEAILKINGQQVVTDEQGNFSETIDLLDGVNIIEITAEKRHGRQQKVYRQVIVNQVEINMGGQDEGQAN